MPFTMRAVSRAPKFAVTFLVTAAVAVAPLAAPATVAEASTTTTTSTVRAAVSTYTKSTAGTSNYSGSSVVWVSSGKYTGYVQFDLSSVDLSTVTKAQLLITPKTVKGTKRIKVRATDSAAAATITPKTAPSVGPLLAVSSKLKKGKRATITLPDVSVLQNTTVLALNLSGGGKISLYKSGSRKPALRLTRETTTTVSGEEPIITPVDPSKEGPAIDLPAASSHKKLVFAHYFPPYPISIDNATPSNDYYARNYLNPDGESGKFAAYGGLLRDRPIPSDPVSSSFKLANLKTEVRQAIASGIDGFAVDLLNTSGSNWDATLNLIAAAESVSSSFKIMLQPDMTASTGSLSATELAATLAPLASSSAVYKLSDGRVVISPFKAENKTASWWSNFLNAMASRGAKAALMPVFVGASTTKISDYASVSYGAGDWGVRNPDNVLDSPNYASSAHKLGLKWMSSVAVQDVRPVAQIYDEAGNTELLRASWSRAIEDGADFVLLTTWNDYSETTTIAPSRNHGYSFLDISAYYQTRFQTGSYSPIKRDVLYISYRIQRYSLKPTDQEKLMSPWPGSGRTAPRDTVEVLSFLTSAATVTITVGNNTTTYSAPAGVSAKTVPLAAARVSASASRDGSTIASVIGHMTVRSSIAQQDLGYYVDSSSRTTPRQS